MPYLSLDGHRFHYQQTGSGPDVVLIHALTANLSVWLLTNIVETLATDFRVTTYDIRGHGASDVPPSGYTSAEMANDFIRLHKALELAPAYLVGHSFGGVIAMHTAVLDPDRVAGIILSDSYFPGLAEIEPDMGQAGPWTELRQVLLACDTEIGETVDFDRLFRAMAEFTDEQMATLKQKLGPPAGRWLAKLAQLAPTTAGREAFEVAGLTEDKIGSVRQPVVALYDEHSPFTTTCRFLQTRLAHCKTDCVPGASHLAPVQNSAGFVSLVQKYLREMAGIDTPIRT